jgi:enediyne biosynthesis protein E4
MHTHSLCLVLLTALCFFLSGCDKTDDKLFTALSSGSTNISFANHIDENSGFNILSYEYMYNGGGVAAGDFNNDNLQDLYFTGNQVSNALFINLGDLKFKEVSNALGVSGRSGWKTGVTTADVNADGFLDIYVCYSGPGHDTLRTNQLFINNGPPAFSFTDRAKEFGLDAVGTYSTQASFFDFDRDGDLDMFLLNHAKITYNPFYNTTKLKNTRHKQFGNRLYRNDGGKFIDVSSDAGIFGSGINFGLGIAISDLNNDGWPDIYVTNDYEEQDFCYLNLKNGKFKECLKESFRHISRFAMGVDAADYNNDGLIDVFVADMLPEDGYRQKILKGPDEFDKYNMLRDSGYHHQNMRNMLQLNLGWESDSTPRFSEIGQLAGVSGTDWSWAPLFVDLDNDGWKDLFVTNGYLRDYTNMDFLKYAFQDHKVKMGQEGKPLDTMEIIKSMPTTKLKNYCFKNTKDLRFENVSDQWGFTETDIATGATFADLDNDGDQDLIVNRINDQALIYRNNTTQILKHHFLKMKFSNEHQNATAIGTKVTVRCGNEKQVQEFFPARGFQSGVAHEMIFGLGIHSKIDEVTVQWPDATETHYHDLSADTAITAKRINAVNANTEERFSGERLFTSIDPKELIPYKHRDNQYIDYKNEFLLPYQLSSTGPCLAKADVNNDGFDDLYIGGSLNGEAKLFLSHRTGYAISGTQPWNEDLYREDTDAVFFDADRDGDLDLYVVRGGAEYFPTRPVNLNDALFVNNGDGKFKKSTDAFLPERSNGSFVIASDYDQDGDIDLFIGGKSLPGHYPLPSDSRLLRNDSKANAVLFSDVTPSTLKRVGMLTTGVWSDINKDNYPELIVAGEFCPVFVFGNNKGKIKVDTSSYIPGSRGLWRKIIATDVDNDGDEDLIAGNAGINNPFKPSSDFPLTIHYHDFNDDAKIDPILSYFIQGKQYVYASRDEMLEQLPHLKRRFIKYADYAEADLKTILSEDQYKRARSIKAETLNSSVFTNIGNGKFNAVPLPIEAQFSAVNGIVADDYDRDGKQDILVAGNFYPYRVQLGRSDAGSGLLLNWREGSAHPIDWKKHGFFADGDVRTMITLKSPAGNVIICGVNNDSLKIFKTKINP